MRKKKGSFLKTFLVGILLLGVLVGIAYGVQMLGNRTDEPKPDDGTVTPPADEPGNDVTDDTVRIVILDGETYRVPIGTTWMQFDEMLDASEDTAAVLDFRFAGLVVDPSTGYQLKGEHGGYPRYQDEIVSGTYTFVEPVLATYSLYVPEYSEEQEVSFYEGYTWEDINKGAEGNPRVSFSNSVFLILGDYVCDSSFNVWKLGENAVLSADMVVPNGEYVISDDSLINAQFEYCGETYGFVEGMTFEDVFCVYEESFQIKDGYLFSFVGLPVLNNETGLPVRVFDVVCVDGVYEKSDCPIDSTFTIYDGDQKQEFDYMFYMEAKWENLISSELSSEGFSIDADGIVVYGAAQRPLLYNGMVVRAEDLVCPLGAYTVENS